MRVDPTAGTGDEVMSDAGTTIGVHFPDRRLRLFTFLMTSEASASLVVAKRRPGRGSSLRSYERPLVANRPTSRFERPAQTDRPQGGSGRSERCVSCRSQVAVKRIDPCRTILLRYGVWRVS